MHSIYRLAHTQKAAKAVRIITKEQGSIEWITTAREQQHHPLITF